MMAYSQPLDEEYEFTDDIDDIKNQELRSLEAIYPDITKINYKLLSGSIDIPIRSEDGIVILLNESKRTHEDASLTAMNFKQKRKTTIHHLPSIKFTFRLTEKYPFEEPLSFQVFSKIIPAKNIFKLLDELNDFWMEHKDEVLFSLVDIIKNKADYHLKELLGPEVDCGENIEKFEYLLHHDKAKIQEEFDNQTFNCEICQCDFKGIVCTQFDICDHSFCNNCLYDFFTTLIDSGSIEKVHCPSFECTEKFNKLREKVLRFHDSDLETFNFDQFKERLMTPPISVELLRKILSSRNSNISESLITRYYNLFSKQQHELISKLFPTRLLPCPYCPEMIFRENVSDPLIICRNCHYAFCHNCRKSWHGNYKPCNKKASGGRYFDVPIDALELWLASDQDSMDRKSLGFLYGRLLMKKAADEYLMDKLFNQLLNDDSQMLKKCPTCEIIIQRSDGCNKMMCPFCKTYFCNICGLYLNPTDPYDHFRAYDSPCYGRLFEGMDGLED